MGYLVKVGALVGFTVSMQQIAIGCGPLLSVAVVFASPTARSTSLTVSSSVKFFVCSVYSV